MEVGEGPKPQFIEIQAPEKLEEGQSFYNQEPFSKLLKTQAESNNINVNYFGFVLTKLSKRIYDGKRKEDWFNRFKIIEKAMDIEYNRLLDDCRAGMRSVNAPALDLQKYILATAQVVEALEDYPEWEEYIAEQRFPSHYKVNGEFMSKERILSGMPESYGAWVSRRLKSNQRQKLLGIEEVFPQGAFQTSPLSGDKKPQSRRWRILKASELIQDRK